MIPWVPLMQFDGPPEALLERCAHKIEHEAAAREQADLLAMSEVLTELRFPDPSLLAFFGGQKPMIESPLLQRMMAQCSHDLIVEALKERFDTIPRDVTKHLRDIVDEKKLKRLMRLAVKCADVDSFRDALLS